MIVMTAIRHSLPCGATLGDITLASSLRSIKRRSRQPRTIATRTGGPDDANTPWRSRCSPVRPWRQQRATCPPIAGTYSVTFTLAFVNPIESDQVSLPGTVTLQTPNGAGEFTGSFIFTGGGSDQ